MKKMSFSIQNKILLGFLFPLVLIVCFSIYINHSIRSSLETANWVRHTQEVITKAHYLEKLMIDMETGQRGFLITGKELFLEPYIASRERWDAEINGMKKLVSDNPVQVNQAKEIEKVAKKWIEKIAEPEIQARRLSAKNGGREIEIEIEIEDGKNIMDDIRQRIAEFILAEESLMVNRVVTASQTAQFTLYTVSFGLPILALAGMIVAVWILFKSILAPLKHLIEATKSVAKGNLNVNIDIRSADEIGLLSQSFNTMTQSLKSSVEQNEKSRTELLNTLLELEKKTDELVKASKHKSQFLANMSHEIRTPINGVQGMLTLLLRSDLSEKLRRYAHLAKESADSLLVIINDILDFSKIEAGKLEIESIEFDLQSLFRDFSHSISHRAQEKNLEFILDLVELPNIKVIGDPGRIRQILNNLVNNAIKFTEKGEIIIKARAEKIEDSRLILNCSVIDTGIGISSEKLPKLFQKFTQEDSTTTRKYGGTGLGLAIVKQLCELMGGGVNVGSKKGRGSDFSFSLTLGRTKNSDTKPLSLDLSDSNILVIDSSSSNCELLRRQLASWKAEVFTLESVDKAKLYLCEKEVKFTATLIDYASLGKLTNEIPEKINELAQSSKIIVMTTLSNEEGSTPISNEKYFNAIKPLTPSDIFDVLNLAIYNKAVDRSRQAERLTSSPTKMRHHRILLVEDNRFNQEVALGFLEDLNLTTGVASNGKEALQQLIDAQKSEPFSLILMDCQMPEMDGYEATRQIRSDLHGANIAEIPIIALTANAMQGDREKCLAAGMNDYLSKPLSIDELEEKLAEWIPNLYKQQAIELKAKKPATESTEPVLQQIWDEARFMKRLKHRRDRAEHLIKRVLESASMIIEDLNNTKGDKDEVAKIAHSLKGMFANFSADQLTDICSRLEHECHTMSDEVIHSTTEDIRSKFAVLSQKLTTWLEQQGQA